MKQHLIWESNQNTTIVLKVLKTSSTQLSWETNMVYIFMFRVSSFLITNFMELYKEKVDKPMIYALIVCEADERELIWWWKQRVWLGKLWFDILDEVLNFHDWIFYYHESFHDKMKSKKYWNYQWISDI